MVYCRLRIEASDTTPPPPLPGPHVGRLDRLDRGLAEPKLRPIPRRKLTGVWYTNTNHSSTQSSTTLSFIFPSHPHSGLAN